MSSKNLDLRTREIRFGWALIMPAIVIIGGLILYPILYNIYISFFDMKVQGMDAKFIGFSNHMQVITDVEFWKSVLTTVIYVLGSTLGTAFLGVIAALIMNKEFPFRGLVRSLLLFPYIAPVVSVVFAWQFFFDPVNGIFMDLTVEKLGIFSQRFNLINSPNTAIIVAILFSIWKMFPFTYLMILSRLQAIDKTLYEAAEVDGCNGWQKFRFITFPEIYFVLGAMILLRIIWNFNKFEDVYLLTRNVKVLSIYTYFEAFTGTMDLGKGAVIALLQFLILISFILF
ncbi:MAG: sugar ABC transporter permease, partial [Spirochaetes bacterium]|nr:sugar ABC transporter permease [Spirochaetota bacterium]